MLVLTEHGQRLLLSWALTNAIPSSVFGVVNLFTNDAVPTVDSVVSDFEMATFPGYEPRNLLREDWSEPEVIDGQVVSIAPRVGEFRFTNYGSEATVNGYFLTDESGDHCIGAELFADPMPTPTCMYLDLIIQLAARNDPGND